ncbi:hypothetical protein scyTo_0001919 [Scyliorhinus torazame]|uniref:Uncharacterized protein n=1 Tax=Scyliorhinus torazame TaxID=75743 RepID=A0A401PGT4_SCYTO|nr:hypothetical protein [Scyliorhinus torazame]
MKATLKTVPNILESDLRSVKKTDALLIPLLMAARCELDKAVLLQHNLEKQNFTKQLLSDNLSSREMDVETKIIMQCVWRMGCFWVDYRHAVIVLFTIALKGS